MNIEKVDEMPTKGQFTAVWIFNNKVWSETYLWVENQLFEYNQGDDDFTTIVPDKFYRQPTIFLVAAE